ncbi:ATP-binding protein [Azotosporobacter soli]|uniref:ATP-binding protein n=1 Tax=Azotosporobacter soli TaxID=3055040 RepID=UPI0031FED944
MLRSIKSQLLMIVFLLVSISFLVSGAVNMYMVSSSFERHSKEDNLMFAEALAKNVYGFFHNAYNIIDGLAKNGEVREMAPEKQRQLFVSTAARFPFFNNLYSTAVSDGMQLARAYGPNASRRNREWFSEMRERAAPWTYSGYTLSGDVAVAAIFSPIFDKRGNYAAIMGGDLKLDYVQDLVERFNERPGSYACVLDGNGVVLAHPERVQFQERYNYQTRSKSVVVKDERGNVVSLAEGGEQKTEVVAIAIPDALHEMAWKALSGEAGTLEFRDLEGRQMIGAYYPVEIPEVPSRWAVITVQDRGVALALVYDVTRRNAVIATVILLLAFSGVYLFVSRRVVQPINDLIEGTDEIARGDLSKRLKISRLKELGQLAKAYNEMAETLELRNLERERDRVALAASETKFSKAFRYYADVIGITRLTDRKIVEVNEAFYEIFGYQAQEVLEHTTMEIGMMPDTEENKAKIAAVYRDLNEGKAVRNREVEWRTKDGMNRLGLWSAEAIEINGERCSIFAWKDISELKKAQQELQEAHNELEVKVELRTQELTALNEELVASNEELSNALAELRRTQDQLVRSEKMAALGGLVAGVAHEINTPIGSSVTAASHLTVISKELREAYQLQKLGTRQFVEYMEDCLEGARIIQVNLERAARLVKSFKQVSADQVSETKRVFKVKEYLEEVLLSIQPHYKRTKHRIVTECDEELEVDTFPGAFSQIITNLLMNSILHAYDESDEGKMTIRVYKEDECLVLDYADDGKGMAKHVQERIFDPFFTTKRGVGGTGLGLYVVYNIITQQLGGSIRCESEPGRGTKFHIRMPL